MIDLDHHLAWRVVQELGHVLKYLSINDRLPTVFMPVSPPSYMNGGPEEFLSWVIESTAADVDPRWIAEMLEGRLPRPVEKTSPEPKGQTQPYMVQSAPNVAKPRPSTLRDGGGNAARVRIRTETCDKLCHGCRVAHLGGQLPTEHRARRTPPGHTGKMVGARP